MSEEELKNIAISSGMPARFFIDKWGFPKKDNEALMHEHIIDPYIAGKPVSALFSDSKSTVYDLALKLTCSTIWKMAKLDAFQRDYFIFPVNELIYQQEVYFHYESAKHTDFSDRATNCELLVLYDLGSTVIPQKQCGLLYSIIRSRYNAGKSTIITSTRPENQLERTLENVLKIFIFENFKSIEVD